MKKLILTKGMITSISNVMPWKLFSVGIGITLDNGEKVSFKKLTSIESIYINGFEKKHMFISNSFSHSLGKEDLCIGMSILLVEFNCADPLDLLGKRITVFLENKKVTMITTEGAYD